MANALVIDSRDTVAVVIEAAAKGASMSTAITSQITGKTWITNQPEPFQDKGRSYQILRI